MVSPEQLGFRSQSKHESESGKTKEYEEDFGNTQAEEMAIEVFKEIPGLQVEKASKQEDQHEGVDFWVTLESSGKRVPVQFTISSSQEKLASKEEKLKSGQVLVSADKDSFARAWENYEEDKEENSEIKPSDELSMEAKLHLLKEFLQKLSPAEQKQLAEQVEWYMRDQQED